MRIVIALGGNVVVPGNGPQAGLLSLRAESYAGAVPHPLDLLEAGTARGR
jgi:carbamate kinase